MPRALIERCSCRHVSASLPRATSCIQVFVLVIHDHAPTPQACTSAAILYIVMVSGITDVILSRVFVFVLMQCLHAAGLQQIVTNFSKTAEGVSGPVAIVAVGSEIARSDLSGLFQFAAIVNINLAVVNALPLPALDGGFLALLLAEAVRGEEYSKLWCKLTFSQLQRCCHRHCQ